MRFSLYLEKHDTKKAPVCRRLFPLFLKSRSLISDRINASFFRDPSPEKDVRGSVLNSKFKQDLRDAVSEFWHPKAPKWDSSRLRLPSTVQLTRLLKGEARYVKTPPDSREIDVGPKYEMFIAHPRNPGYIITSVADGVQYHNTRF